LLSRQTCLGGAATALVCAALVTAGSPGGAGAKVKLEVVKHKDFLKALAKQKGKVVLVDVWGEF
jgi:hypothetical protein